MAVQRVSVPGAIAAPSEAKAPARSEAQVARMQKPKGRMGLVISYTILVIAVIFALYPVYFAFLVSIRPNGQLLSLHLLDMLLPATGVLVQLLQHRDVRAPAVL